MNTLSPVELVLSRLEGVKYVGPGQWKAWCPVCDTDRPRKRHLYVARGEGLDALLDCKRGCTSGTGSERVRKVCAAIGLEPRHLHVEAASYAPPPPRPGPAPDKWCAVAGWLTTQLRETLPADEVLALIGDTGIEAHPTYIRQVYGDLDGEPRKVGFNPSRWVWDPLETPAARQARSEFSLNEPPLVETDRGGNGPILNEQARNQKASNHAGSHEGRELGDGQSPFGDLAEAKTPQEAAEVRDVREGRQLGADAKGDSCDKTVENGRTYAGSHEGRMGEDNVNVGENRGTLVPNVSVSTSGSVSERVPGGTFDVSAVASFEVEGYDNYEAFERVAIQAESEERRVAREAS
jgi:hypothetical protein